MRSQGLGGDHASVGALKAQSLGQYKLVKKLGTGGMAEVFLAAQEMEADLTRPVVIKAILPHLAEDERFVDMFMREARVAAMLSHPNIVHIHDVTKLEGRPCIVMEFLKGRDLWTVMQRLQGRGEAAPPHHAAAVIAQAAAGLDYAHRKRDRQGQSLDLVHRDISPHNLFLTRDGQIRVLDFGIAKSAYQTQRTESGVIKGKLPYMAPEQARGKDVDHRADLFALGVVLWEMLTGKRLFARDDPLQTMAAMFSEAVPKPSTVRPCPDVLEQITMRALARSPTDRFDSCESMATALRAWLASEGAGGETRLVKRLLNLAVPVGEDEAFYAAEAETSELGPEELQLVANELTPSHSGIGAKLFDLDQPPAPSITPPPDQRRPRTIPMWVWGAGAALLLLGAFGITAYALSSDDEPPLLNAPGQFGGAPQVSEGPREPVEVSFTNVPEGVVIEVDGRALEGAVLRVPPSDDVHRVRALYEGRELWRYDGLFRSAMEVDVPDLQLPAAAGASSDPAEQDDESDEAEDTDVEDTDEGDDLADDEDEAETDDEPRPPRRTTMRRRGYGPVMTLRPTMRVSMTSTMRVRMTSSMRTRMLGMQIDLSYP